MGCFTTFPLYVMMMMTIILAGVPAGRGGAEGLDALGVLQEDYPRAFFFRSSEGAAANRQLSFERWEAAFSRLMGIEGKVLDEEVPGRSERNVDFFTRFKQRHPGQLVMLHYNGNARDPRYQTEAFFAGHWVYYNGATVTEDVPAEEGETEIKVDDPTLFFTGIGRYRNSNEDVGLCLLDAEGRPDWHHNEQVQLIAVDPQRKVLRVRRGCYGTRPMAFAAGKSYAAAHVAEGPWGGQSNLLWFYNYSTRCPRDAGGRMAAEVHCDDLARRFLPGGELEAFDGLEFDVLHHRTAGGGGRRGADCDADGRIDNGLFDGVNAYGIGVVEFCRMLREKLGPERLILADGMSLNNQRAFSILNGIESEGWPALSDWEIRDWSGGLNRHWFWGKNAHPPVFNYINHKYTAAGAEPGQRVRPDVPFSVHRLVFAVATFTDAAVCYSFTPPAERGELIGIWDELCKGTEKELGWLGRPLGPAVRLAESAPDLLASAGDPVSADLAARFAGDGAALTVLEGGGLKVTSADPDAEEIRFRLRGVPCDGPDLFVSVTAGGTPMQGYPEEVARLTWVGIAAPEGKLVRPELPETGIQLRGQEEMDIAAETGASVQWGAAVALGGQEHDCYRVHPPYRGGVGNVYWQRDLEVPPAANLEFYTGMGEKSPERSDGVTFTVLAGEIANGRVVRYQGLFEHSQKAFEWVGHQVSLEACAGKRVRLRFVADCGPDDNATTDHAHWGDVAVLAPNEDVPTPPVRYMTWLNNREFTSGFYFSDVRSKQVDLEWRVEGSEPIWISSIRAHAHADAIYREFEHGLVLANPSPRPYRFDLERLFAGCEFRRLRGSAEQDPAANNGAAVGGTLTLGPKEGLFLVKTTGP